MSTGAPDRHTLRERNLGPTMELAGVHAMSALELAARMRARELSPVEVIDVHIRRIEEVNPVLNALVADRFQAAREEARAAEHALAGAGPHPPLLGVPFTVKEMINVEGMPITFGALSRKGRVADRDATVVARLRQAGAIPLGVSNVPEWGMWFESTNLVYGRTSNPHDPTRTPGGSSGGEGALVASGASPFGIGSDIGGSIRIPAALCGVFGHKPSAGLVPLTGHYPVYESGSDAGLAQRSPYVVLGPITRHARDLWPLLRIIAGPDGVDPNTEPLELGSPDAVEWRGRKVLVLEHPRIRFAALPSAYAMEATTRAASFFKERKAKVEWLEEEFFRDAFDLWLAALAEAGPATLGELAGIPGWGGLLRAIAAGAGKHPSHSTPLLLFCLGERILPRHRARLERLVEEGRRMAQKLSDRLGDGILLMPAHPRIAPHHGSPLRRPFDFAYTAALSTLRIPATVVPSDLWHEGMPLGVQIAARRGNDHLTIAAAVAMEDGGRVGALRTPNPGLANESTAADD